MIWRLLVQNEPKIGHFCFWVVQNHQNGVEVFKTGLALVENLLPVLLNLILSDSDERCIGYGQKHRRRNDKIQFKRSLTEMTIAVEVEENKLNGGP